MSRSPEDLCKIAAALVTIRVSSGPIRAAAQALLDAEQGLKTMREYRDGCDKTRKDAWQRVNHIGDPDRYDSLDCAERFETAARCYRTYEAACNSLCAARCKYDAACTALDSLLVSPEERAEMRKAAQKTRAPKGSNDE